MRRVLKMFTVAAGVLAVAWGVPATTFAACPLQGQFSTAQTFTIGGVYFGWDPLNPNVGGTYWFLGQGDDAQGTGAGGDLTGGNDAGQCESDAVDPAFLGPCGWISDLVGDGSTRSSAWDFGNPGGDGCPTESSVLAMLVKDDTGSAALISVMATPDGSGNANWDLESFINGVPGPLTGFLDANSAQIQPTKPFVTASALVPAGVQVTVNPAGIALHDDAGGTRPIPLVLTGTVGGVPGTVLGGAGTHTVDADTDLCWGIADGLFNYTIACRAIGGSTPSQNVNNARASKNRGNVVFDWDVTAQLDVLGFNIVEKDPTKGSERKLNAQPIFSGQNDGTSESYSVPVGRSEIKGNPTSRLYEIELVQQDGTATRFPVQLQ